MQQLPWRYSQQWFETFLHTIAPAQTRRETEFISRQFPLPQFTRILDICCGDGRHSTELSAMGYEVTGIDIDAAQIERARRRTGASARFLVHDLRDLQRLPETFDAAMILWQSFGQFDAQANRDVLAQAAGKLRADGRFILDIYHRAFFEKRQGVLHQQRGARPYTETKQMIDDRLVVELEYEDGGRDRFDWQLFHPEEITALAASEGFEPVMMCSEFDVSHLPDPDRPRAQYVFRKRS